MPASPVAPPPSVPRRRLALLLVNASFLAFALLVIFIQSRKDSPLAQAHSLSDAATLITTPSLTPGLPTPTETPPPVTPTTAVFTSEPTEAIPAVATQAADPLFGPGRLYLSIDRGGHHHLFAYHPQLQPLTQLTTGPWDDITPAASPDGLRLAFASNRDGPWDLYLLDLLTGGITRLTQTLEYDAAPSWSSDGRWLAYETYLGEADPSQGGLEIFLRPIPDETQAPAEPVRLTDNPAADYSPAWSPDGRKISFVSNRTGEPEIWLADLDKGEDRFTNLSQNTRSIESHPAWSPDGRMLAWSASAGGFRSLLGLTLEKPQGTPQSIGAGDWPAWSAGGGSLFASVAAPNRTYLTGYSAASAGSPASILALPPLALSGEIQGLTWGSAPLPEPLSDPLAQAASAPAEQLWQPILAPSDGSFEGRRQIVALPDVDTQYPLLQDLVDEGFSALRYELAARGGWDFLASLENAYVPLTVPLFPGMGEDWLYTGRAFTFNTAPLHAGWLVVVREDYGGETYWRVYLRTRYQDGSQGLPLHDLPWNFDARSSGDPRAYEEGGALAAAAPTGYWLDLTELASAFGWERLPALTVWRSAYPAARFNEFVLTGGLDWQSAMLEIYPAEALITPTPLVPPIHAPAKTWVPAGTSNPMQNPYLANTPTPAAALSLPPTDPSDTP